MIFRLFAAFLYDLFVIVALYFFVAAIGVTFNHGEAIAAGNRWFQGLLLSIFFLYYYVSLRQGGQTIGMRAWALQLRRRGFVLINLRSR